MKQLITIILLSATLSAYSAPAHTRNIEPAAVKAFEASFGKEVPASWMVTPEGCQVIFELKGQTITAVYTNAGQLRWYKKHILSTQLPVTLQMALKDKFKQYWIADVVEQSGKEGSVYTMTLESRAAQLQLKSTGGIWHIAKTKAKG